MRGDAILLRQVMVNLLGNAVKYSAPNPTPVVTVSSCEQSGEVVVTVADNGVGFDPRYADKLFGMFSRLHRADEFEGNGVGLAMVKKVVQRHGGRVWAEGTPSEGAAFHPRRFAPTRVNEGFRGWRGRAMVMVFTLPRTHP